MLRTIPRRLRPPARSAGWPVRLPAAVLLAALCLAGMPGRASAQDASAGDLVAGALKALSLVDQGRTGELWDGAAPMARQRIARDDFMAQVAKAREALGANERRTWVSIQRHVLPPTDPDTAGQYATIECESLFAQRPGMAVREVVSFRLDDDRIWRFSGYFVK